MKGCSVELNTQEKYTGTKTNYKSNKVGLILRLEVDSNSNLIELV